MKRFALLISLLIILSVFTVSASDRVIIKAEANSNVIEDIINNPHILYFKIGRSYYDIGDFQRAEKSFQASIQIMPDFKEAHYNLGVVYYMKGESANAIDEINKAIEIDESYSRAYYSLGLIYYEIKDYDNSIANLLRVVELEENPNANFDLGVVYADRFRYGNGDVTDLSEAIKYYQKAEDIQPGFPHAVDNALILQNILSES